LVRERRNDKDMGCWKCGSEWRQSTDFHNVKKGSGEWTNKDTTKVLVAKA
jgi:hypothetical protein